MTAFTAAPRGVRFKIPLPTSRRLSSQRLVRSALGLLLLFMLFVSWSAQAANRTLTVSKTGTGTGTVNGVGLTNCGSTVSSCTASYASGTTVRLTATPTASQTFTGWSGHCSGTGSCTVSMSLNRRVTANFTAPAPTAAVPSVVFGSATQYQRVTAQITWGPGTIPTAFAVQLTHATSSPPITSGRVTTVVFTPQLPGSQTWIVTTGTGSSTRTVATNVITVANAPPFVVIPNTPTFAAATDIGLCRPQCPAFVQAQLKLPGGRGEAKNFWTNPYTAEGYVNQPQGQSKRPPRPGDIVVWSGGLGASSCAQTQGCAGHVAIVQTVDLASGTMTIADSNWDNRCTVRELVPMTLTKSSTGNYTIGGPPSAIHILGWQSKN